MSEFNDLLKMIPVTKQVDNEIVEFSETGAIFSQSEIIDFSHGTDSEGP